ncbi:hypothetical protein RUM44_005489 [Polyplax serrata]|uniref:Uncharacterized protein n=1 Tax=Polyplax serrata TaxID=468196 RepID=A0ABR1AEU0_POLSC
MGGHSSPSGGVKVFSIGGRMVDIRQRCMGMTDEERRWRAQFLKDQQLSHNEPREVPELYKDTTNFFRRLYDRPSRNLEKALTSTMDWTRATSCTVQYSRAPLSIDDTIFPNYEKKSDQEYFDHGFRSSPLAKKVERPTPAPEVPRVLDASCGSQL